MEREEVLRWLETHPEAVHGDVKVLLGRCERSVRRHAREDAWVAAKHLVERCEKEWGRSNGGRASEAYVAREVCRQLADELRTHEPKPHPGDEEHLAGGPVKAAVNGEGWMVMMRWVLDVAREEEHRTWDEIVDYTRNRAHDLIRAHHLSDDCSWDHSRCYGEVAIHIAQLLERDYSEHAFPR